MHTFLEVVQEIKKSFDNADDVVLAKIEDSREETSVATAAHAVDSYLIYNKALYKVITAIEVGDTLVISPVTGANIELADDIMSMVEALSTSNQAISDEIADMNNVLGAKNLLPNEAVSQTINEVTFTVNSDGSIGTSGTSTDGVGNFIIGQITPQQSGKYILSGCSGGTDSTYFFNFDGTTAYKQYNDEIQLDLVGGTTYSLRLWIATSGVDMSNKTFYPMIRPASIQDDTYEPYAKTNQQLTKDTNAIEPMLNVLGAKNLLPNNATTQVVNGITWTVNSDGTVTANGTATADSSLAISTITVPKGSYIKTGCPSGGAYDKYVFGGSSGAELGDGLAINLVQDTELSFVCAIAANYTANNLTFKPMLRPASIADDTYVPYAKTNRELTLKGVDVEILTITGTSGTGSSTGFMTISKATYPYKALIPFGLTTDARYSIELYNETESVWLFGVRNTNQGAWVEGATVTFKAFAIK